MSVARTHRWQTTAAAVLVASSFAVAGVLKLDDPARFASDIGHYRLVPPLVAAGLALYLPWLELTLAAGLLIPRLRRTSSRLGSILLVSFCLALASTLLRGIDVRCGCFGGGGAGVTAGWALARNVVLIALLWLVSAEGRTRAAVNNRSG